jgi:hypothetical protein
MTIVALLPVLVLVFGLVLYFFCLSVTKATVAEVGRIMFFCGLLAFLLGSGGQSCSMSAGASHHAER